MNDKFIYKRYSPEYKDRVINLLDGLWHFGRDEKLSYFKWKYEDNPFTDDVIGFIALDGEKVVAFRGYMVQPMRIGDKEFLNAQLADTVTDSNYRRKGLFQSITSFSVSVLEKDPRFLVSLNSSSGGPTLGGYLKLNWKPLSEREHLFRMTVNGIFRKIFHKEKVFQEYFVNKGALTFVFTRKNRYDEMATMPFGYNRISHLHSALYYKWRLNNPHSDYVYAYLYKNGALVSYYIFINLGGGRYDLIDFNGRTEAFLKILLDLFVKKTSPLYISLWTVGKTNIIFQKPGKYGFIKLNKILRHINKFRKSPFLVRSFRRSNVDLFKQDSWNINKIIADEV